MTRFFGIFSILSVCGFCCIVMLLLLFWCWEGPGCRTRPPVVAGKRRWPRICLGKRCWGPVLAGGWSDLGYWGCYPHQTNKNQKKSFLVYGCMLASRARAADRWRQGSRTRWQYLRTYAD